jgi:hypothetical protein
VAVCSLCLCSSSFVFFNHAIISSREKGSYRKNAPLIAKDAPLGHFAPILSIVALSFPIALRTKPSAAPVGYLTALRLLAR